MAVRRNPNRRPCITTKETMQVRRKICDEVMIEATEKDGRATAQKCFSCTRRIEKGFSEARMRTKVSVAVAAVLVMTMTVFAHGDKKHVMGILQSVSAEAVTVKEGDGKIVMVKLTPTTMYVMRDAKGGDGTPAKATDLAVGQRVIIHATPKGNDLLADQVKFAPAAAAKP